MNLTIEQKDSISINIESMLLDNTKENILGEVADMLIQVGACPTDVVEIFEDYLNNEVANDVALNIKIVNGL